MTRPNVQLALGFGGTAASVTWTDITQWVLIQEGIRNTRGSSEELSAPQTATSSLVLDNSDGRFTAGLATSPYYPYVRKGCPIREMITTLEGVNFLTNPGFEGGIDGWVSDLSDVGIFPAIDPDDAPVHSGLGSARLQWQDGVVGGYVETDVFGLDVGALYTASLYVYVQAGDVPVTLGVQGGPVSAASSLFDAWQRLTVTFTATAAAHRLQVTITSIPAFDSFAWIDDGQVEEGATATAYDGRPARTHERFYGTVNNFPTKWKGLHSTVSITASDLFKWMGRLPALRATLVEEIMLCGPLAYYVLSEPADSTSAGDLSGTTAGSLAIAQAGAGGTLTFAEATGPAADGLSCPNFTPASISAGKYLTSDLGQDFEDTVTLNYIYTECWFSTTTTGRVIFAVTSPSSIAILIFSLDASGFLKVESSAAGSSAMSSSTPAGVPNLADGLVHQLVYDEANGMIYVDGVAHAVSVASMFNLRTLTVGGYAGTRLWQGGISHLALFAPAVNSGVTAADLVDHYTAGTTGYAGEDANARIARIARYAGIQGLITSGDFSPVASQGAGGKAPLDAMREVEATESGKLICDRAGASLIFQSRTVRYNPVVALALHYADTETDGIEFSDDDQKLQNDITISRPGGATVRVSAQESIDAYGRYGEPISLLKMSDAEALDAGYWLVSRYADPPPELRQLPVEGYTLPLATYRALLDADVSTVLQLDDCPAEAPASTVVVSVEGYTETITHNHHEIDFHTSRATTDTVWVLDDTAYSVLGTSTRLAY